MKAEVKIPELSTANLRYACQCTPALPLNFSVSQVPVHSDLRALGSLEFPARLQDCLVVNIALVPAQVDCRRP